MAEAAKLAVKDKYNVKDFVEQISNVYEQELIRMKKARLPAGRQAGAQKPRA